MQSIKNLTIKSKKNGVNLNNVSLEIREKDFIVITGENYKEVNLLLSVISGLVFNYTGEIYIDGIELTKHSGSQILENRRKKFGCVLLGSELDQNLTVSENVSMPLEFSHIDPEDALAKLNRAISIMGLDYVKNERVSKLSDWQQNKVMLARAIVNEPTTLVLYEPTKVVDETKKLEIIKLLSALNREGVTIVVGSNDQSYLQIAKRIINVSGGVIEEQLKEKKTQTVRKRTTKAKNKEED